MCPMRVCGHVLPIVDIEGHLIIIIIHILFGSSYEASLVREAGMGLPEYCL